MLEISIACPLERLFSKSFELVAERMLCGLEVDVDRMSIVEGADFMNSENAE